MQIRDLIPAQGTADAELVDAVFAAADELLNHLDQGAHVGKADERVAALREAADRFAEWRILTLLDLHSPCLAVAGLLHADNEER